MTLVKRSKKKDSHYGTLFAQGILCDKYQMVKYNGTKSIKKQGKKIFCNTGGYLKPIDVLINPFTGGKELKDVNPNPFKHFLDYVNPISILTGLGGKLVNWYQGVKEFDQSSQTTSVESYGFNISEINVAQDEDINSYHKSYLTWKEKNPGKDLILWGVSRGGAIVFNAFSKYHYPEAKLVILEACFDSVTNIFKENCFAPISNLVNFGLNLFTKYQSKGPSPEENVNNFPENVPVVFISSKMDQIVPYSSTVRLAQKLADKGKNEVYLLTLKRSSHPNYMFDDQKDRDHYENFIHAIYEKYGMPFKPEFAEKGRKLLEKCLLVPNQSSQDKLNLGGVK